MPWLISPRSAVFWLAFGCFASFCVNFLPEFKAPLTKLRVKSEFFVGKIVEASSDYASLFSSDDFYRTFYEKIVPWPTTIRNGDDSEAFLDETEKVSRKLRESVKIYCLVMTSAEYQPFLAPVVRDTWGKKCDGLMFVSDVEDGTLPSMQFCDPINSTYRNWQCVRESFEWLYEAQILDRYDFFLKANEETYVVMENLRWFLHRGGYNPDGVHYIGRDMAPHSDHWRELVKEKKMPHRYANGKAGYVLSRGAVKKLYEKAFQNSTLCTDAEIGLDLDEDVQMGRCMENIGVEIEYTLDGYGRQRFNNYAPWKILFEGQVSPTDWILRHDRYPYTEGYEGCSESAITFSDVHYDSMLTLEYFINRLRTVGTRLRRPQIYTGTQGAQEETYNSVLGLLRKNNYQIK